MLRQGSRSFIVKWRAKLRIGNPTDYIRYTSYEPNRFGPSQPSLYTVYRLRSLVFFRDFGRREGFLRLNDEEAGACCDSKPTSWHNPPKSACFRSS